MLIAQTAMAIEQMNEDDDSDDEVLVESLLAIACEPLLRRDLQQVGVQRLSIARLQQEVLHAGITGDDVSASIYRRFSFRLADLPTVVQVLEPPPGIRTVGGHTFTGEEAVLLLLRRMRSTDPLRTLTEETGRSDSAISEAVRFMVEHINRRFVLLAM